MNMYSLVLLLHQIFQIVSGETDDSNIDRSIHHLGEIGEELFKRVRIEQTVLEAKSRKNKPKMAYSRDLLKMAGQQCGLWIEIAVILIETGDMVWFGMGGHDWHGLDDWHG